MGTTIKASAISINAAASSLELISQAATLCLEKAGMNKNDIDMLINIGIYHDDNMMEPAMAPIIHQQLGINTGPVKKAGNYTFCFDLYNGACGFINATQVADSAITSGQAKHVLIVSGDTHPSKTQGHDFPFSPVGTAVLLNHSGDHDRGFKNFFINTSGNDYHGFRGGIELSNMGAGGRGYIDLYQERRFINELCEFVDQSSDEYFKEQTIAPEKISFLVTSQLDKDFSGHIHDAVGLNGTSKTVELYKQYGDTHTSSLPLGYHQISENGELQENDTILFVAAGSGLTAAFAMYTA